jgi:hypothetical protein
MSTTCKACGGHVCEYCGGCITCGECSCMYDEIDKATADTKAQLDAANARIADLEAKLAEAIKGIESALSYVGNECLCPDAEDKEFLRGLVPEDELNAPCVPCQLRALIAKLKEA